tara:strand:- start:8251 stop:8445 length:195 start_codon:yes stop_codon:yes gene_type:complete
MKSEYVKKLEENCQCLIAEVQIAERENLLLKSKLTNLSYILDKKLPDLLKSIKKITALKNERDS